MARRVAWVVAAGAAVALAIQGCARPGQPEAEPTPMPTASVSASESALPTIAPPPPPNGGQGGDGGFAWVPFGPADPASPGGWYRALETGDCEGVATNAEDSLVVALAALCRVVFEQNPAQWALVQQHNSLPRKDDRGPEHQCLEDAGVALLARALDWHAKHPGQIPKVALPGAGGAVACGFEIMTVDPPQGVVGEEVDIRGRGLNEVTVFFGDVETTKPTGYTDIVDGVEISVVEVAAPEPRGAGTVDVRVRSRAGEVVKRAAFTYLTDGASPSPSDSPRPPTDGPTTPPPTTSPPTTPPQTTDGPTPAPGPS